MNWTFGGAASRRVSGGCLVSPVGSRPRDLCLLERHGDADRQASGGAPLVHFTEQRVGWRHTQAHGTQEREEVAGLGQRRRAWRVLEPLFATESSNRRFVCRLVGLKLLRSKKRRLVKLPPYPRPTTPARICFLNPPNYLFM